MNDAILSTGFWPIPGQNDGNRYPSILLEKPVHFAKIFHLLSKAMLSKKDSNKETIKNFVQETHIFMRRLTFALIAIIFVSFLLIIRLFYMQVIQKDTYTTLARENQFNLLPIEPNRGLIFDRNGVLLAKNIPVFNLEITPERVTNLKQTLTDLQSIIDITPDDLQQFEKALKQHHAFEPVTLKIKLSDEEVAKFAVNQYRFPGVAINARLMRYYPLGAEMNSVVGYVGRINEQDLLNIDTANYNGSNYIGKLGVEKYFEKELHGTVGYQQVEMNAGGRVIRTLKRIPTISGDNLYLTIDSNLQSYAEKVMGDISGAVVVIQPKTGQILALVSNPNYDPNLFVNGISTVDYQQLQNEPHKPLFNRAIRGQFPIGSTIKPFMAIGGLDYGAITPDFSIFDSGLFSLPGVNHLYHDWIWPRTHHGHGVVNVTKAIMVSCDTFMWNLGIKLGVDRLTENLRRFGFGKKTGIEMDEELGGLVPSPAWKRKTYGAPWFAGDTVAISIGQGYILGTPMQLAQAVAVIANRGIRYKPTLLLKTQKPDGAMIEQKPIVEDPVKLSDPKYWDIVYQGMEAVVSDPQGTAYPVWHDAAYQAAAKTGTAQVVKITTYGEVNPANLPENQRNHALFIAFAPANDPQIAIAVVAEHSLVPSAAKQIARKIVDYYLLSEHHDLIKDSKAIENPSTELDSTQDNGSE